MDSIPEMAPAISKSKRTRIVAAMLISTFMAAAEVTIISTAMPTIVARLGGFDLFTWAFGIYLLGQAVTTPIYGRLADSYGRRNVYLFSTALFLAGSLLCGLAWSMPSLIVFRAIQGLGGGGLVPLATTIISDVCEPKDRPRVLSYVSGVWGIAAIAGPLLGSLCVGTLGWPFVFWINLPVGAVTALLVIRHLADPPRVRPAAGVDIAGTALLAAGVGAAMAVLIQWQSLGLAWLGALGCVAAACLAAFAWQERRASQPMLGAHLLRRPVILAADLSALLNGALVIGATAFLPAWVQGALGRTALVAGLVLGVMTVSWTTASLSLGRVLARLNTRNVAVSGAVALVLGSAGLWWLHADSGMPALLMACVVLGVGLGVCSLVFTVAVQSQVTYADRGRAISLYYFCRLIGQAVGAAAFGGMLNAGLAAAGPAAHDALRQLMDPVSRAALPAEQVAPLVTVLAGALHGVFGLCLVVAAVALPVALLVPVRRTA
jgi:multidrug resistance protein